MPLPFPPKYARYDVALTGGESIMPAEGEKHAEKIVMYRKGDRRAEQPV